MKSALILVLSIWSITIQCQTDQELAYDLAVKAIEEMESGNIDGAIEYLDQSKKLDPDNISYPYEIAFAHYLDENYRDAIKVLKKLTKHKHTYDQIWQMLGNCYDMDKKPEKAIETYEEGLILFPNSGILNLERGNMELHIEEYNNALYFYERGIEVDPGFSSNYYWASKIYLSSNEEIWGLIYGELFMNLERNTERTAEISKILFDVYASEIDISSDSSKTVSLCQQMTINITDISDSTAFKLPFCMIYEPTLLLSLINVKSLDIHSLHQIRQRFIQNYFDSGHDKSFPNALFDYQKMILNAGHLEAYNHWVLMKGAEDDFITWLDSNGDDWEAFVNWFTDNPIDISLTNRFYRDQY